MKNKNVLILGSRGMAGHLINLFLKDHIHGNVYSLDKEQLFIDDQNRWKNQLKDFLKKNLVDYLINCIGILNKKQFYDPVLTLHINSLLPHELVQISNEYNIKVIHLSTDCWKDIDIYGRSKRAGEIDYSGHLTIRTSIIGPELKNGTGLFHWFMNQKNETNGFIDHIWDGITTLELAKKICEIIEKNLEIEGIVDFRTMEHISKYDLLKDIRDVFNKKIIIHKKSTEKVNKTNSDAEIKCNINLKKQIIDMKKWMENHSELYDTYLK